MNPDKWSVERYPGFAFRGPRGGLALTDLTIMRKPGETAVVLATERADNPGASVTNAAEQLAAAILAKHFPGHSAGSAPPFTLIEHYPGNREMQAGFQEVVFADLRVRCERAVPRIGDVKEWRTVDFEPALALEPQRERSR